MASKSGKSSVNTFSGGMNLFNFLYENIIIGKTPGVYMIVNVLNNKRYIGSSMNLKRRLRDHLSVLIRNKHCNEHLQSAFNKYGQKCFSFCVLEECEPILDTLLFLEQKYLDLNPEYNKAPIAGNNSGWSPSEETRKKHSIRMSGKINFNTIKKSSYREFDGYIAKNKRVPCDRIRSIMKPVIQYDINMNMLREYESISNAAKSLNVLRHGIRDCCSGKQLSAYKYIWRFKNNIDEVK